jgi:hypothetical protein
VVRFVKAVFSSGEFSFDRAAFSGVTVDFRQATGTAPSDLVPQGAEPVPNGLFLPSGWSM